MSKFIVPLELLDISVTAATPADGFHSLYFKNHFLKSKSHTGDETDVVLDRPLTGYVLPSGPFIHVNSSDTVLEAIQKLQWETQNAIALTEIDPQFNAWQTANSTNIINWSTAYSWGNHASAGYIDGSGDVTYLSKWTDANSLGNSQIADNGTSLGIGTNPAGGIKLDVVTTSLVQSIRGINILNSVGNKKAVEGTALGVGGTNIGGYFTSSNGSTNYSVWLQDETEDVGKFLKSVTDDGKANWAFILPGDITLDTTHRFVTDTQVSTWNAKADPLGFTPENVSNKVIAFQVTPDDTHYPSEKLVKDYLDAKADLVAGKIPAQQLPSYVDDVVNLVTLFETDPITGNNGEMYYNTISKKILTYATGVWGNPTTPEDGKIYIVIDTNLVYRWGGLDMANVAPSLALGETVLTAYRGDRGKIAYDHSQVSHAYLPLAGGTLSGTLTLPSATINTALTLATDTTQLLTRNSSTGVIEYIPSDTITSLTFQNVYNNSSTPAVLTDNTRGAVIIQNGQSLDTSIIFETKNIAGNVKFSVTGAGNIVANAAQVVSLAGTSDRIVQADSTGNISATRGIIPGYITDSAAIALLVFAPNWTINGVYTGVAITGTYQGQNYVDDNYFYTAILDNTWIRLIRG